MNVTWSGGLPPYTLLIVPEHAAMITNQIPSYNWDAATFSLQLPLPQGKRMVMTMSDWGGFASSGVSEIVVLEFNSSKLELKSFELRFAVRKYSIGKSIFLANSFCQFRPISEHFGRLWCRRRALRDGEIVDLADDSPTPTPGIYEPTPYSPRGSASYKHVSAVSTPPPGVSDVDAASSSQPSAAAIAGPSLTPELSTTSASIPTTYIVHTDAEDARRNVVELPPQYDERTSSGLLDVSSSARADDSSPSPLVTPSEKDVLVLSPPTT
ncbi:hypothetical protein EWM64_g1989 [Hericium alpestre]|uniref:Uncharacterized protein n=1 Tax=Hericium alpestre TaxID=135208 RepID=A0A4Z0A5M5_9AGAM|nr:hypothetical protein EWM64_g1989 [Hericium alpestre]